MPFDEIMSKWKAGTLHSGSTRGPVVRDQKQALAIAMRYKGKQRGDTKHGFERLGRRT